MHPSPDTALLWSLRPDGSCRYLNRSWIEFTRSRSAAVRWEDWASDTDWSDRAEFGARLRDALERRRAFKLELLISRKDQERQWLLISGNPRYGRGGKFLGYLGCAVDVTDSKHFEAESERFVMMLSHDLRMPLTAARMAAELMQKFAGDPCRVSTLGGQVMRQIDRADKMIRDLLDAARIRTGQGLLLDFVEGELQELVSRTLNELTALHGQRFVLRCPYRMRGWWCTDELRRAIENLCSNAVKYGDPRSPVVVTVEHDDDDLVRINVHNQGRPIPACRIPGLFEPFRREVGQHPRRERGWGLGLTLVRGVAEAHGGRVEVTSSLEGGTTFALVLPRDCRVSPELLGRTAS